MDWFLYDVDLRHESVKGTLLFGTLYSHECLKNRNNQLKEPPLKYESQ